jgi:hypothetical protein
LSTSSRIAYEFGHHLLMRPRSERTASSFESAWE